VPASSNPSDPGQRHGFDRARGIRNAAATVVLAYILGLRESSVMSLTTRAQNITHTAIDEGVSEDI
jgi:hypothetical protein